MYMRRSSPVTTIPTVKARAHAGTGSMDLTIPARLCRAYEIREGDIFSVDVREDGRSLILSYRRVYQTAKSHL